MPDAPARLAVMASGGGTNFQAILDACASGSLNARVVALAADKKCRAIRRAEGAGVPVVYLSWQPYRDAGKSRKEYDADLAAQVRKFKPDFVVLAGWMRLLSMAFIEHFPMQILNLHPALPGAFPGTHAIERAFQAYQQGQIEHTGVMVHFVPDEGVDDGPLIRKETVPIFPDDSLDSLEARIHETEHRVFVDAIKSVIT